MNETQAFIVARQHLVTALREYGYDCAVQAGRQPTKQLLRDNTVYLFAISENRHGAQRRNYNPHDGHMGHVESTLVSKTVQAQVFRKHDITDVDDYTASDLCAVVKMIISSLPYIELLQSQGVGISNVTDMREPEFINAAGDYEKNPSFDFDLSFTRTIKPATKPVTTIKPELVGI